MEKRTNARSVMEKKGITKKRKIQKSNGSARLRVATAEISQEAEMNELQNIAPAKMSEAVIETGIAGERRTTNERYCKRT